MYYFYNLNTKIFCNLNKTLRQYLLQVRSDIEAMERLTKLKIKQLFFFLFPFCFQNSKQFRKPMSHYSHKNKN